MIERIKKTKQQIPHITAFKVNAFPTSILWKLFYPPWVCTIFSYDNDTIYTTLHLYVSYFMNVFLEGNDYGFLSSNIINKLSTKFSSEFELKHLNQKY